MARPIDLTGQRFGQLLVLEEACRDKGVKWRCRCDCGRTHVVHGRALRRGLTISCGCYRPPRPNRTHGGKPKQLHVAWKNMRHRCYNQSAPNFAYYGGRGITVSGWANYEEFRDWALANGWRPGLQIDRRDNNLGYSRENCHFVTNKENQNNRNNNRCITWAGKTLTLSQWADELGVNREALRARLRYGWPLERVFSQPYRIGSAGR